MMNFFRKNWPIFTIILFVLVFFWKVVFLGQAPIPGDFITGTYYPWLDYKWGYEVGVPVKNSITSDVVSIMYPIKGYVVDQLKQFRLPLWNPTMFVGSPLLANFQAAVFSPTMIFYFLLPKIPAWTLQIMFQPLLSAVFMYFLLRDFGLKKIESLFGGIFYAFSAFSIIWLEWNANTLAAAFIPLILLSVDKFINSKSFRWGVLLSVSICMQIFSGYPQLVIFTLIAIFLFLIFKAKELTKVKLFYVLFFVLLGYFLSSVISIPGIELILNSQRRFTLLESNLIYLPWQNLITFLAPDYFGNPATGNYFGIGNYTINAGYTGVIVLGLALVGFWRHRTQKPVLFFATLLLISLILALPTAFARVLFESRIPGISASSNTRILVLANLSLSVLAAFGISALFKKIKNQDLVFVSTPLIILFVVSVWTFFAGDHRVISLRNLVLPVIFSSASIVLILFGQWFYKKRFLSFVLILAVCLIATIELFRYGWKYTPFSSPALIFPETPALSFLKNEKGIFRISPGNTIPMNMWVPYSLESASGYNATYPIWWAKLFSVLVSRNPENTSLSFYAPFEEYQSRWFDLLNNKYLLVFDPENPTSNKADLLLLNQIENLKKFKKVFRDKSVAVYENLDFFPRAFVVSDWEYKSDRETLSALLDPDFPLDKKIILNEEVGQPIGGGIKSNVSYGFYSAEKSLINVETDGPGFLFISSEWYPGWRAKIDGKDAKIYRADYAFQALPISKGNHRVELIYDPESLRVGEFVSLGTLLFLTAVFIYDLKKNEKVFS